MKKSEANLAIQVLPKVEGAEIYRVVEAVISYIESTGLEYFVGPFETAIEGDFDRLCDVAKECQLICIRKGAASVSTYMKMMYNPTDGMKNISEKMAKFHGEK